MKRQFIAASIAAVVFGVLCLAARADRSAQAQAGAEPMTPPQLVFQRCPFPMPPGEVDGLTIRCGVLTVRQDRSKPDGPQVDLVFAVLKSRSRTPRPDPLLHLHGGPAAGSLPVIDAAVQVFETARQERDVILFDQRGAGYSTPSLNCYDLPVVEEPAADVTPQPSQESVRRSTLVACAKALQERGVDLSMYNSEEGAQDVIDLANALKLKSYNLSGVSYGARLAQEVMRRQPAGLRSVVLDSGYAPGAKPYEDYFVKGWETFQNVFADCEADAACRTAYPNLRQRTLALLHALDRRPRHVQVGAFDFMLTGYEFMRPFLFGQDNPRVAAYIPRLVAEVEQDRWTTLIDVLRGDIPAPADLAQEDAAGYGMRIGSPAAVFEESVQRALAGRTGAAGDALRSAYRGLFRVIQGRGALRDFVLRNFDGAAALDLMGQLAAMSDADLEQLYRANRVPIRSSRELGPFLTYECHDAYPFNEPNQVAAKAAALPFVVPPEPIDSLRATIAECDVWPSGAADLATRDPVTSTIPVLVLHGRYDWVTPPSWSKAVAAQFPHAALVEIGDRGHGLVSSSACARAVEVGFLNNPTAPVDATCAAGTRLSFAPLRDSN